MEYGVDGRVLFCGQLEKRRNGAVRGGWATRVFLLTPDSLHYFRRVTEPELLGEERGHIALSAITSVRAMPEDDVPQLAAEAGVEYYYLQIQAEGRVWLMRAPLAEASTCESWSIAIEEQRKVLRTASEQPAERCGSSSARSALSTLTSPSLLATNHELNAYVECHPPRIVMVSVVSTNERDAIKPQEIVIKRKVAWGDVLDLGVVAHGGACVILLQDGGIGRIGTQALMGSWDAGKPSWIEAVGTTYPTEVEVSVTCKVLSQPKSSLARARAESMSLALPNWVEWVDEGASMGFLLMCLFVHVLYGVDGFHWSHKCCLTLGAALAIITLLNGSSKSKSASTPRAASTSKATAASNPLPKLQFSLTIHRCRLKTDTSEYLFPPEPVSQPTKV